MKIRRIFYIGGALALGVALWNSPLRYPHKPKLFKSTVYPPKTPEEKAMWDWYHAIRKVDPDYEWKMPIEFYGKAVDQFGGPVPGAQVNLMWSAIGGTPEKTIATGSDGKFSFLGEKGKGLTVIVRKDRYLSRGVDTRKSFEYANFCDEDFHVPDAQNPVIFRLHKIMEAEPLYIFQPMAVLKPGDAPLWLDIAKGRMSGSGDIAMKLTVGEGRNINGADYTFEMEAVEGAGFVLAEKDFGTTAPESNYQKALKRTEEVANRAYNNQQNFVMFVRTRTGNYAYVVVNVILSISGKSADVTAGIHYNPSGSRILEFDPAKILNR